MILLGRKTFSLALTFLPFSTCILSFPLGTIGEGKEVGAVLSILALKANTILIDTLG